MNDLGRQPVVHVGLPKTATKLLQMQLFAPHCQVEFLGTYIGSHRRFRNCRDAAVEELIGELFWDNWRRPNLKRCRELMSRFRESAATAQKLLVWSWESLMEDRLPVRRKRAENLKAAAGDCTILVGLRHPVKLVESLYLQLMRRDNIGGRASKWRGVRFETIDTWLTRRWNLPSRPPNQQLDYARTVEMYADVFGADAVKIVLFEELVRDQDAYISKICRLLGIDAAEGIRHTQDRIENERLSQGQMDSLAAISRSLPRSLAFRFADRAGRKRMLATATAGSGKKARVRIPPDWQRRIEDLTRPGNRRLAERWQLPMAEHDYPL